MARVDPKHKIEFDQPATIAELIEALEDLRDQVGPGWLVRSTGFIELHKDGPHVRTITAHEPTD